ncbi:Irc22p NDAI_0A08270 [Naumovozyma dairenensis CBS 421]|uniref:Increased recombination centers protein 22 n=1 Tax=Naumovozyma dairenensis (strain ATCC 10597 / BCRC 20456 / CBS 421 / NBRC 0211 / NRRL Y-12639) TaxID=1071378 RepID=G0W592_NAUDC|nr:hypothetical protein NDAI_0A08270 [Naumovozyma dairenensis CBS 421]CCD22980.1 hypothetical protein NDAI_0A08270 [Naumovozyma dairenensis CBS 421]
MRLNLVLTTCLSLMSAVKLSVAQDVEDAIDPSDIILDNEKQEVVPPSQQNTINLNITYEINERLDADKSEFLEFYNDELATLNYTFVNNEDRNITIMGIGGHILSMPNGEMAANITVGKVGPILVGINETARFQQQLQFHLDEGQYYLIPIVHITDDDITKIELGEEVPTMKVTVPPSFVQIVEPPLPFFSFEFLSVELFLVAIIGGASYYYFVYRPNTITQDLKKKNKKKAAKTVAGSSEEDKSEWLPEQYKK